MLARNKAKAPSKAVIVPERAFILSLALLATTNSVEAVSSFVTAERAEFNKSSLANRGGAQLIKKKERLRDMKCNFFMNAIELILSFLLAFRDPSSPVASAQYRIVGHLPLNSYLRLHLSEILELGLRYGQCAGLLFLDLS